MDPLRNPYSPGAGARPQALVGREIELQSFDLAIQRLALGRSAKSIILTGLRGVGKTVLLNEFGRIATSHNWIHEPLEVRDNLDFARAMGTLCRKSMLRVSRGRRTSDRFQRVAGALRSFQITWKIADIGSIDVEPFAGLGDSGVMDTDLSELFTELGHLAQEHNRGVVFTIDEMQYLSKDQLASLVQAFHIVAQHEVPIMMAGAGLPSLIGLIGEARSYAERLFDFRSIGSLSSDLAAIALEQPASDEHVAWHPDAVQFVTNLARGYPYFLQEFGKHSWDVSEDLESISLSDTQHAIPLALAELDTGFFNVRIDRANRSELNYLRAMASMGVGPYSSGAVAKTQGKTARQLGIVRDNLIRRGLCFSPRWGEIDFTVPMFDEFIRRTMQ